MASSTSSYFPLPSSHGDLGHGQDHELESIATQHESHVASLDANHTRHSTVAKPFRPDDESGKWVCNVQAESS